MMKYKIQSNYQENNNKMEVANIEYRKFSRLKLHKNQLEGEVSKTASEERIFYNTRF